MVSIGLKAGRLKTRTILGEILNEEIGVLLLEGLSGVGSAGSENDTAGGLSGSDTGGSILEDDA